jgi:4-amino-4-deoxy-L-arabinose transferase-like glycosyltransferase
MRIISVLAICAPLLAPLCQPELLNPDEGRYVEIGREMAATGDWLVPRLNGVPHWAKPPLTYWAIAASLAAFGAHEWAARVPSAAAAVLALAGTWFLARRMGGERVALVSVVLLATMLEFHVLGRGVTADMMQTAFITWAAALAWNARTERADPDSAKARPAILKRLAPFACLGLAFLAKGPVGLGVFFSGLIVFLVLRPRVSLLSWRELAPGLLLCLAIGLPWFIVVSRLHPDLASFYLGGEVRDRVLTTHGRGQAFWFYPAILLVGTLPWTPALVAALAGLAGGLWKGGPPGAGTGDDRKFLLAWIAGPFLLFSLSGSKLAPYLLPLMPMCAIATARWFSALPEARGAARGWTATLALIPGVIAVAASVLAIRREGDRPAWIALAAAVAAGSLAIAGACRFRRGLEPATAIFGVALLMIGWEWTAAAIAGLGLETRTHAGHSWVRAALANEEVRGMPIGSFLRPQDESAPAAPPTFVRYRLKANSLGFYALGLRPEYVPVYGAPEDWEIQSDQDAAHTATLEELAALLDSPGRVHVIARVSARPEIEAAAGRPLRPVASRGKGDQAVVLLASR